LGHVECAECDGVPSPATRWCLVCDDPFCDVHWDDLHRAGNRSRHPFCPVDPATGSVDANATSAAGGSAGRFAAVGPSARGGGDDGAGGLAASEGDANFPGDAGGGEGDATGGWQAVTGEYADPTAGSAMGSAWQEAWDEEGNQYWHNPTTGDSTYDIPY
jgi:hypothetical protein